MADRPVIRVAAPAPRRVLLREVLGETLRQLRTEQTKTLREVSELARVSLGYLSEVERGQKEPSSELLGSICSALETPLSEVLGLVSEKLAMHEKVTVLPVRSSVDASVAA